MAGPVAAMSRPQNVLHVIRPELAGSLGGADMHVLDLCAAQAESGLCKASVLALGASPDFLAQAARRGVQVWDPVTPRTGRESGAGRATPADMGPQPGSTSRWRRFGELPRRLGTDVVHAHGYESDYAVTFAPLLARAWRGLPRVMTCHGIITPDLRHKIMSRIDLWCMHRASQLIAVAQSSAAMLRAAVPGIPVHLIPNGILPPTGDVDPTRRQRVRAELGAGQADAVLIGYVGRLSGEKRPDLLVSAAGLLRTTCPDARIAIVGGGQLGPTVARSVREAGLDDRVVLAGLRHDMDDVYAAIDVLAVPSDIEGTPRVLIEAQMRGVPAVATAVGGMPALVRDGVDGLLIPAGRADALATALSRLIRDADLRKRLAAAAAVSARGRTAQAMADTVQAVYDLL